MLGQLDINIKCQQWCRASWLVSVDWYKHLGKLATSMKAEYIPCNPAISLLGIYITKLVHTCIIRFNIRMFVVALFVITIKWKQSKCLSTVVCLYSGMIHNWEWSMATCSNMNESQKYVATKDAKHTSKKCIKYDSIYMQFRNRQIH